MGMPSGVRAIDLMLQIPSEDFSQKYEFLKPLLLDRESREMFKFPAQYMFRDVPEPGKASDYVALTLTEMDRFGIERAMIGVGIGDDGPSPASPERGRQLSDARRALKE